MQSVDPNAVIAFLTTRLAQKELEIAMQAVAIRDLQAELAKETEG